MGQQVEQKGKGVRQRKKPAEGKKADTKYTVALFCETPSP